MAWLAVDYDETEFIMKEKPKRILVKGRHEGQDFECYANPNPVLGSSFRLPTGSIEKLIGKKLTWNDEPVKIE